jgi:prepilin-type N-terminal cleavage/methylation domain-containing protein
MKTEQRQGFTLIEVLMALAVLGVGIIGLYSMGAVTVRGNTMAGDMTAASNIAESWLSRLRREALMWREGIPLDPIYQQMPMPLLRRLPLPARGASTGWFEANNGQRILKIGWTQRQGEWGKFCVHIRLTWIVPRELVRAEARVLWFKEEVPDKASIYPQCGRGNETQMARDISRIHTIILSTTLRRRI